MRDHQKKNMLSQVWLWLIILLPLLFYGYTIVNHFWLLPCHRDSVEYLAPAIFGTSWGGYYPWLDRISLAIGLRIWLLISALPPEQAAAWFILLINASLLGVGMWWATRQAGMWAGLMFGALFNVSYLFLLYGSIVYPDQLLALFALLAYIAFSAAYNTGLREEKQAQISMLVCGFFTAAACFSKINGMVSLIFFLGMIAWKKDWKRLLWFSGGLAIGSVVLLGLYAWLYHPESLIYTIKQFFLSNISENLEVINKYYVSYLNVVLDMLYFPFLALIVLAGAYRKEETRNLFIMAWGYIIWMYCFVAFAGAGNGPHARYILPAYLFTILGLAVYLVDEIKALRKAESKPTYTVLTLIAFGLIFVGLWVGRQFNPEDYTPTKFPYYIKWLYVLGPLILVFSLVVFEWLKKGAAFWVFLFTCSLWIAAYDGGWAYSYHKQLSSYCRDMFGAAEVLSHVPSKEFGVYVQSFKQLEHPERIIWVYKYFYDTKYPRVGGHQTLAEFNRQINQGIRYIPGEVKLLSVPGNTILTDQENVVRHYYPQAQKIKELVWKNEILVVLQWK